MANFDVIFRGEEVEIAKIGDNIGESGAQGLFKYQIGFSVSLAVAEIRVIKGTPLLSDFRPIFDIFRLISAPSPPPISPKFGKRVYSTPI